MDFTTWMNTKPLQVINCLKDSVHAAVSTPCLPPTGIMALISTTRSMPGFLQKVDPNASSLGPWQCEKSLKVLQARITGIPRPGLEDTLLEAYAGQTQAVHDQLYDRIARLAGSYHQLDCMELSLESRLDKLSGLSKLKELGVTDMNTRIGINELQWMTEHWSRLRTVYVLRDKGNEETLSKEALRRPQENRPNIEVKNP